MKVHKFPKVNLQKLSHAQLRSLLQNITDHWSSKEQIPDTIELLLADVTPLLSTMDAIITHESASSHAKDVRSADYLRDRAYRLLLKKISDSSLEFETALVEAGEQLTPIVNSFRTKITRASYSEQTASLKLVTEELRKPTNFAALTSLGLTIYLEQLEKLNQNFESKWNDSIVENLPEEELPLLSSVRTTLEKTLRLLLKVSSFLYSKKHASIDNALFKSIEMELIKVNGQNRNQ